MKFLPFFAIALVGFFSVGEISAQKVPTLEFYYGAQCPHCHEEKKWFPTLKKMYPDLKIQEYEVWNNPQNQKKAQARLEELGQKLSGVPTNIIDNEIIVGFDQNKILEIMATKYGAPLEVTAEVSEVNFWTNLEDFLSSNGIFVVITVIVLGVVGVMFGRKN